MQGDKEKLKRFIKKEGRKAEAILSAVGKKSEFVDALNTDIGQQLMKDLLRLSERKLQLIIDDKDTVMDKATFKVCKFLAAKWVGRINSYNKGIDKIFNQG